MSPISYRQLSPIARAGMRDGSDLRVSFEFFPPKSEKMGQSLWRSINRLAEYQPHFVSVTYGAGGSTRKRTHETVARILRETSLTPAAHLTCVAATRSEVDEVLRAYWEVGVRHIVALRGDPPDGIGEKYAPHPDGYANAAELAAGARAIAPFEISVGCYPEVHPESESLAFDIDLLKKKIDAGATRAITQFFFDNEVYYRYMDAVRAAGVEIPIVPGLMPVSNTQSLTRMAAMCGATAPVWLMRHFDGLDEDAETRKLVAAAVLAEQCVDLVENGFIDLHFYTLNRADLVYAVCKILGLPRAAAEAASQESAA